MKVDTDVSGQEWRLLTLPNIITVHISIVSKENEAFSHKENEAWWRMFKNTKKVNIVQEQQKIKSFSLRELTKQNKGRTKETRNAKEEQYSTTVK